MLTWHPLSSNLPRCSRLGVVVGGVGVVMMVLGGCSGGGDGGGCSGGVDGVGGVVGCDGVGVAGVGGEDGGVGGDGGENVVGMVY